MWRYKLTQELYHAGVKGMKWGVRKQKENLSPEEATARAKKRRKIAIGVGVGVVAAGLAAFGTYKLVKYKQSLANAKKINDGLAAIKNAENLANTKKINDTLASIRNSVGNLEQFSQSVMFNR